MDILDRLRAATEGTTPGPWAYNNHREVGPMHTGDDQAWGMICAPVCDVSFDARYLGNARFIADARTLIPEAADTIEALRAEVEALKAGRRAAWEAGRDAAADAAEAVGAARCIRCGNPRDNHPYRHPFVSDWGKSPVAAIRALTPPAPDA